jgi:hypothetical protein
MLLQKLVCKDQDGSQMIAAASKVAVSSGQSILNWIIGDPFPIRWCCARLDHCHRQRRWYLSQLIESIEKTNRTGSPADLIEVV